MIDSENKLNQWLIDKKFLKREQKMMIPLCFENLVK